MKEKFNRFMMGRYGVDELSRFLLIVMVVIMVLNTFIRVPLFNALVIAVIVFIYFRMFSRNYAARYSENSRYLELKNKVTGVFSKEKRTMQDRKTNHIYKCPNCKQKIRIPRGKGKICITCPKCKHEFVKKS